MYRTTTIFAYFSTFLLTQIRLVKKLDQIVHGYLSIHIPFTLHYSINKRYFKFDISLSKNITHPTRQHINLLLCAASIRYSKCKRHKNMIWNISYIEIVNRRLRNLISSYSLKKKKSVYCFKILSLQSISAQ